MDSNKRNDSGKSDNKGDDDSENRSDYSFMRSGLIGVPGQQADFGDAGALDMSSMLALVACFMRRALSSAGEFTEHNGRRSVTANDIRRALKHEVFVFSGRAGVEAEVTELCEYFRSLDSDGETDDDPFDGSDDGSGGNVSDSDGNSDGYETRGSEVGGDDEDDSILRCDCATCRNIFNIEDVWSAWTPTDTIGLSLKHAIDATV